MASMNKNTNKTASTTSAKTLQGLNITGNIRVWVKTFNSMTGEARKAYSVSISHKNQKGEYDKCYMPVFFSSNAKPSVDMEDGGYDITIKNAFMTCTKKGDGFAPALMVTDWE